MTEFNHGFYPFSKRVQVNYSYRLFLLLSIFLLVVLVSGCKQSVLDVSARGDIVALESMIAENPDLMTLKNDRGKTALHHAAVHNRLDSVEVLVAHKVNVNEQDGTGQTALHIAASGDYFHVVRALIAAGADVGIQDDFGDTALHSAAMHGRVKALKELLKSDGDKELLNHSGLSPAALAAKFSREYAVNLLNETL